MPHWVVLIFNCRSNLLFVSDRKTNQVSLNLRYNSLFFSQLKDHYFLIVFVSYDSSCIRQLLTGRSTNNARETTVKVEVVFYCLNKMTKSNFFLRLSHYFMTLCFEVSQLFICFYWWGFNLMY